MRQQQFAPKTERQTDAMERLIARHDRGNESNTRTPIAWQTSVKDLCWKSWPICVFVINGQTQTKRYKSHQWVSRQFVLGLHLPLEAWHAPPSAEPVSEFIIKKNIAESGHSTGWSKRKDLSQNRTWTAQPCGLTHLGCALKNKNKNGWSHSKKAPWTVNPF